MFFFCTVDSLLSLFARDTTKEKAGTKTEVTDIHIV